MPDCCPECFGDRHLTKNIFPSEISADSICAFCSAQDQPLLNPAELRELFELLLGAYHQDSEGMPLLHWFQTDWSMFIKAELGEKSANQLLESIYEDGEIVRQRYQPVVKEETGFVNQWEAFREELMFRNRFFPDRLLKEERLSELLQYLLINAGEYPDDWFRARIQKGDGCYSREEMGAPPAHLTSHGRANPAGIPYLYLASTEDTAVSEVRPHTGEVATVADFEIGNGQQLVDLRHPRITASPFMLADESAVALLRSDIALLERLGRELTRPVLPESVATDYVPSQFLCEFIKKAGYGGVLYSSSVVADGVNLALFDPSAATAGEIRQRRVSRVAVELENL